MVFIAFIKGSAEGAVFALAALGLVWLVTMWRDCREADRRERAGADTPPAEER